MITPIFRLILAAVALSFVPRAKPATLSTIPMQGGMVMPMISYHADEDRLRVMMDPTLPELIPLLISHPGDSFDISDPWYDALDPSRQGLAFSRRYGFVMNAMTDPLPLGREIWIRRLSSTPGLSAYRYASSDPRAFTPIFGTDGAADALAWNGMMFHPVFTAPPGATNQSATFEAVLVDPETGVELPGSSTGPFSLSWTIVPDGRPELGIGQRIVIFWPASASGYVLEGAETVPGGEWTAVTNAPIALEGESAVVLDPRETRKFFRMKQVP